MTEGKYPFAIVGEEQNATATPVAELQQTFHKLSVLMPVYNEQWTLSDIIDRVLTSPISLDIEVVAVDDRSRDESWSVLLDLARNDSRIKPVRHTVNQGKGAAIRTAIEHMTGDIAVVQDADLEYDPHEYPLLLEPILQNKADAVFGSRFAGHTRRVLPFWHGLVNRTLTLMSNMLNDLNLTDMETCYKMVRSDILKQLRLSSNSFTLEPELTCRLSQWQARIYEVPISYYSRSFQEGKKIRPRDGLKAIGAMLRAKYFDPRFTDHERFYTQARMAKAVKYHHRMAEQIRPFLGQRVVETGAGIGNLSILLLNRLQLLLMEDDAMFVDVLKRRFGRRDGVAIEHTDLSSSETFRRWQEQEFDTVLCSNLLQYPDCDEAVLQGFFDALTPGGHCAVFIPRHPQASDASTRRCIYTVEELRQKMTAAGFEIVTSRQFGRFDVLHRGISPTTGLALLMVGRKPQAAAKQAAA